LQINWKVLTEAAEQASRQAYAVYSNFAVGAAVCTSEGRVFAGCNVENSSYGLTMCAERVAVFTAAAQGVRELAAVAIYTPTDEPAMPCGACRQVLAEFASDLPVRITCKGGATAEYKLAELLPHRFSFPDR
jgi:cytidine deaminase